MKIRYPREKLQEILTDLHLLTGISLSFLDAEGNTLCRKVKDEDFCSLYQKEAGNKMACRASDEEILFRSRESGEYESHICPEGLYDAVFPIKKDSLTVGYILMGRIRLEGKSPRSKKHYCSLYEKIPVFSEEKLSSLRSLFSNILFSSAIEFEKEEIFEQIKRYLDDNLEKDIRVDSVCGKFFISKTSLYRLFQGNIGISVKEYLIASRIEKAKEYLLQTDEPVCRICERVGVPNYTYFCKLFRKREGVTPQSYRKKNR